MKESQYVKLSSIFLDLENPRHEPFGSEKEVIQFMWEKEQILSLAKDIALNGLTDFEVLALFSNPQGGYTVAEGNRRVCALKLLTDPELAPDERSRNQMRRVAENWDIIDEVLAVVYDSAEDEDLLLWREKTHLGQDEGRGRKTWNAHAKQRHTKLDKYELAAAVLRYAVSKGWLSEEERAQVRLSTLQRVLDNKYFKTFTSLKSDGKGVKSDLNPLDFDSIFKRLVDDVSSGRVNSRKGITTAAEIEDYTKQNPPKNPRIAEWYINEVDEKRADESEQDVDEPEEVDEGSTERAENSPSHSEKPSPRVRPQIPRAARLKWERELSESFAEINFKIASLYFSVCDVDVEKHPALVSVGLWSLLESLTAAAGRNVNDTNFHSYVKGNNRDGELYGNDKDIPNTCERIMHYGNSTKHHPVAAQLNSKQIVNDWENIQPLLHNLVAKVSEGR